MKIPVFAAVVFSAFLAASASGQVKSVAAANNASSPPATNQTSTNTRARVLGQDSRPNSNSDSSQPKSDFNHSETSRLKRANTSTPEPLSPSRPTSATHTSRAGHSALKPSGSATPMSLAVTPTPANPTSVASSAVQTYRVGVGDVLDIQLAGNSTRNSTLFTVLDNGVLEYPLAGNPIVVSGMTTSEVASLLRQRIKIFENPNVAVSVRDYASHSISISGFVAAPGTKVLRREAVPLYTVLAEALVLPEAGRATITRAGRDLIVVDIKDSDLSNTLVLAGDSIKVSGMPPAPTEFYFVGGEINSPGQKPFHSGLTLTQAVLASGGAKANAGGKVKISRQGTNGRLSTTEFNLRKIQSGKEPDPAVQKGDRIEVAN
ncbi:MAG TPA: polysaccharide biosynthesis/export family protein [Pyrinomonadaceae bacterium]|nr:polysaccharide biosynthesis/export family protein [Pyrinomonadaceae bacterium]